MLSIDEAIAHAREVAEEQRKDNGKCEYKAEYGCKGCADYYSKPCIECAEEHEQLAEWLELLKWYQQGMEDIPSESLVLPKDVYHAGYENAIDDLIAKCESAKFADYDETVLSDIHQEVNSGLAMAIHFAKELRGGKYEIN